MKNSLLFVFILFISFYSNAQKILFDATKGETAGCADWIIDADATNLNWSSTNPYINANNWRSNAQRIPTPPQSGITPTTTEDYWIGGISNWAVDCAKKKYTVETLPAITGRITYNDNTNTQDLSKYNVYIVTEPNLLFTVAEKTAIMKFVQNGGGLFMVSDHDVSDRNGDTYDSPHIWNDLISNNTVQNYPFGIVFDYQNFSGNSTSILAADTNLINGPMGKVAKVQWSNGTSMTIDPVANNTVKSVVFKSGTTSGNLNVLVAYSSFGKGRIVAIGDSSPCDDGTGNPNAAANTCTLYNGYINDAGPVTGNHQKLLMNATIWLATNPLSTEKQTIPNFNFSVVPNPIQNKELKINYTLTENEPITVAIFDTLGRTIKTETYSNSEIGFNSKSISLDNLNAGVYFCKIFNTNISNSLPFVIN